MTERSSVPSEGESVSALSVPGYMANRFIVLVGPQYVRLMFGDQAAANLPVTFHSHVVLSHEDTQGLIDLLQLMKASHESKSATKN